MFPHLWQEGGNGIDIDSVTESIVDVIKHQSTPEVDSQVTRREELKRRVLEECRMRECDRCNLAGVFDACTSPAQR